MKIIKPSVEIIPQESGLEGIYKQIELAGRNAYKSHDKIEEGSALKFIDKVLLPREHYSPCEHGTVYLKEELPMKKFIKITQNNYTKGKDMFLGTLLEHFNEDRYSKTGCVRTENTFVLYVTTNYRVLIERNLLHLLDKHLCEPTEYHPKRITTKWTTQIAVSREANRHRVNSVIEESTRYCNYSKEKFGNEIKISEPTFIDKWGSWKYSFDEIYNQWKTGLVPKDITPIDYWFAANQFAEYCYMGMIECGAVAQEARTILPLDTQTEVYYTAFVDDWKHFFSLRCSQAAHPDIRVLAEDLKRQFEEQHII